MRTEREFKAWLSDITTQTMFNWLQVRAAMRPEPNADFAAQLPTDWREAHKPTAQVRHPQYH